MRGPLVFCHRETTCGTFAGASAAKEAAAMPGSIAKILAGAASLGAA